MTSETTPAPEVARLIERGNAVAFCLDQATVLAERKDQIGVLRDGRSMILELVAALSSTASQLAAANLRIAELEGKK